MSSTPIQEHLAHGQFHARESTAGIGAAVISSETESGERAGECIVTDGREWHYVRVLGAGFGPFPNISTEDVEEGIQCFAATLPSQDRIGHLLNANPMHIDREGNVSD